MLGSKNLNFFQVIEFLKYHRKVHFVDHFFLYNSGGITESLLSLLKPQISEGIVSITDFREVLLFSIKLWGQVKLKKS